MSREILRPRLAGIGFASSVLVLVNGCVIDVEEGRGSFEGNAYGPVTKGDQLDETDDSSDAESTGDDGETESGEDAGEPATSGSTTSDPGSDPTDEPPDDPTSEPTDDPPGAGGTQPGSGMYASCLTADQCPGLLGCATVGDPPNDGFCTDHCAGPNNPATCAPSPGGTSTPTCMVLSGYHLCALDCSNGKTCPQPMVCTSVADEQGTRDICY